MRSRDWCFTFNNYTPEDESRIKNIPARYTIFGREVAPTTGTPHLQGYIYFENPRGLQAVRKLLKGAHVTARYKHSTPGQAADYCRKTAVDVYESGAIPENHAIKSEAVNAYHEAVTLAMQGNIKDVRPAILLRHYATLHKIYNDNRPLPKTLDHNVRVGLWIWGKPGSGKTKYVFDNFPNHYMKTKTKWWDNYIDEEVVAMQDITPDWFIRNIDQILEWTDIYPFACEFKGGTYRGGIRPRRMIFTSNFDLNAIVSCHEQKDAVLRRFEILYI